MSSRTDRAPGVAGISDAERVLASIETGDDGPTRWAICGPAGSGKSALLTTVHERLTARGHRVVATRGGALTCPTDLNSARTTVVVDDAHLLTEREVVQLRAMLQRPVGLVVASRPWPTPAGLDDVLAELRGPEGAVALQPMELSGVVRRVQSIVGGQPHETPCRFLLDLTGGSPFLLDAALRVDGSRELACSAVFDSSGWLAEIERIVGGRLDSLDRRTRAVLLAITWGVPPTAEALGSALGTPVTGTEADRMRRRIEAEGLLGVLPVHPWFEVHPVASSLLRSRVGDELRLTMGRRLVDQLLEHTQPDVAAVRSLVHGGHKDPRLARLLLDEATTTMRSRPEVACGLLAEAQEAGADRTALAAVRSQAAARAGDFDLALLSADEVMGQSGHPDTSTAAQAAAVAYAHRAMLGRSAELYRFIDTDSIRPDAAEAAVAFIAVGELQAAEPMLALARQAGPMSLTGGLALMADGLRQSLRGDGTGALPSLTQAVTLMSPAGAGSLLLETPASLAALVGLHCGALDAAESALAQADRADLGGRLFRSRHALLRGWTAMLRGDLTAASLVVDEIATVATLATRDLIFLHALRIGIARRNNDIKDLTAGWSAAHEVVAGHDTDLFTLLPLGELILAAAHLGIDHRLQAGLDQALDLLRRVGEPALWAAPLHWAGVQTAILREQPHDLIPHAEALVAASKASRHAAVLATAGQTWLKVLAGESDPEQVKRAAAGLVHAELPLDAARLVSQAAIRTTDRAEMLNLLQYARTLRRLQTPPAREPALSRPGNIPDPGPACLSDREWEVAVLVVAGLTYKEIGHRLFISPKTVEHHAARIRSHLGVGSRREMLDMLRELVGPARASG